MGWSQCDATSILTFDILAIDHDKKAYHRAGYIGGDLIWWLLVYICMCIIFGYLLDSTCVQ